jgi:hypothetical protein
VRKRDLTRAHLIASDGRGGDGRSLGLRGRPWLMLTRWELRQHVGCVSKLLCMCVGAYAAPPFFLFLLRGSPWRDVVCLEENNVGCRCFYVLLSWDYRTCCEPVLSVFEKGTTVLSTLGEKYRCDAAFRPSDPASMPSLPTSRERFVVAGADDTGPWQSCDKGSDGLREEGVRRARTRRFVLITLRSAFDPCLRHFLGSVCDVCGRSA